MLFLAFVCGQLKSNFSHSFGALAGLWFTFAVFAALLTVLLVELLLASLTFLLKALNNIDRSTSCSHTRQRVVMFIRRSGHGVLTDLDLTLD